MSKLAAEDKFLDLSDYGRPFAKLFANQLKNLVKTVGLATIILMPGGSKFFILIHYLKLRDYFISDSFSYLKNKDI